MNDAIDLSQLPVPSVIEELDYEVIVAEQLDDLVARYPSYDVPAESDPAYKILEVAAYREMLVRQRVNEAAKAVMLAYAMAGDLDNLGALFNVERLQISPSDPEAVPPVPPQYETDEAYRRRILLSLRGLSTAGPEGAYIYHALSAEGGVLDASATSPTPGDVVVTVLAREGNGAAGSALLQAVETAVNAEDVRPLTDHVIVQSAEIIDYSITATLYFQPGPDSQVVLVEAQRQAQRYVEQQHRLGVDITLSGVYAALHRPGVQRVELENPTSTITIDPTQAGYCTAITLTDGGIDE
ncbi:baseplate assembly protein [Halomonas caseinilytica]|uniref:baseplate assembly protein n=1 Tax=Halomonas caseinilytica TaxID=438744 RepID=UPI0007E57C86|nr:baseplate J/gp47 family protein [Halomonas caseinilytica]SEM52638.1 Phage-related baseplate assembly protein [Halomonas caseinilytica]